MLNEADKLSATASQDLNRLPESSMQQSAEILFLQRSLGGRSTEGNKDV